MSATSIFLAGDVMTGRRISDHLRTLDSPATLWGDALTEWQQHPKAARVANLETAVSTAPEAYPEKRFHFRMDPANVPVLRAAGFNICTLANNHLLDAGHQGMADTLAALRAAGIQTTGAGANHAQAAQPAWTTLTDGRRLLVFAYAHPSSFTPRGWAAGSNTPGINLLPDYSAGSLLRVAREIRKARQPGDVVLAAMHWGPNWSYRVSAGQRWFARRLIDFAGVDIIQGHSSHHPKAVELYRNRPIIYACGDLINDYDHCKRPGYRADLAPLYFLELREDGALARLSVRLMRISGYQLARAIREDCQWLCETINRGGVTQQEEPVGRWQKLTRRTFNTRWVVGDQGRIEVVEK